MVMVMVMVLLITSPLNRALRLGGDIGTRRLENFYIQSFIINLMEHFSGLLVLALALFSDRHHRLIPPWTFLSLRCNMEISGSYLGSILS